MDESKSTRLLRFRLMLVNMSDHLKANQKFKNQLEGGKKGGSEREGGKGEGRKGGWEGRKEEEEEDSYDQSPLECATEPLMI